MPIKYQMVENNLQEGTYYARVVRGDQHNLGHMMPDVIEKTSLNEPDIRGTIITIANQCVPVLQRGDTVVIDGFISSMYMALSASFDSKDAVVTKDNVTVNIHMTLDDALAEKVLTGLTFEKVTVPTKAPSIDGFLDVATKTADQYTAGSIISITGSNLKFDENDPTQGVFLVVGETETRLTVYSQITRSSIDTLVPAGLSGAITRVEVRARYTDTGELRVGAYTQEIVSA